MPVSNTTKSEQRTNMNITRIAHYAIAAHKQKNQARRYTGEDYQVHLAETAAMAALIHFDYSDEVSMAAFLAVAWCHDLIEDTDTTIGDLHELVRTWPVADRTNFILGVITLTDPVGEDINRETRLRLKAEKLIDAPRWIQALSLCDANSNIPSIAHHDPSFAKVYLKDKAATIDKFKHKHPIVMKFLDPVLADIERILSTQEHCPVCDKGVMVKRLKDIHFVGDSGLIEVIPNLEGSHCTRCAHAHIPAGQVTKRIRKIASRPNSNIRILA